MKENNVNEETNAPTEYDNPACSEEEFAALHEKYCSCGYKAQAYLSCSDEGDRAGFKRSAIILCPCCGRKIYI